MAEIPSSLLLILGLLISPSLQYTSYDPDTCAIVGDPDLYGIGIRIGFYLVYFSGLVAVCFQNWSAVHDARVGVYIVNAAILVALIRDATLEGSFASFEWYILVQIGVFVPTTLSATTQGEHPLVLALCMIVDGTYALLQPWIYFTKLHQGWDTNCPAPRVFIFAEIDFYGPRFVSFLKAMSVISCVGGVLLFLISAWYFIASIPGMKERHPKVYTAVERGINDSHSILSWEHAITVVSILSFGLIIIICTEKTLALNHVVLADAAMASTGQLIPFITGVLTTMSTLYTVFTTPILLTSDKSGDNPDSVNSAVGDNSEVQYVMSHGAKTD